MTRLTRAPRLSELGIKHELHKPVDFYATRDAEIWILHEAGCQRAMSAGGLCSCEDPETFTIAGPPRSRKFHWL